MREDRQTVYPPSSVFCDMKSKALPYNLEPVEPELIGFAKFNGGIIIRSEGTLFGIGKEFIGIKLEDGSNVYFRRKNGWGVGISKYWRLSIFEREKYVYGQMKSGLKLRFKST